MLDRTCSPDLRLPLRSSRLIFHDKPQQTVSVKTLRKSSQGQLFSEWARCMSVIGVKGDLTGELPNVRF
jgi:hypothetical protein